MYNITYNKKEQRTAEPENHSTVSKYIIIYYCGINTMTWFLDMKFRVGLYKFKCTLKLKKQQNKTRHTAGCRSPALIHKWNNLSVRYAGLICVPIILIEPKYIWNTTFRLIILGKLDGPGYTTNVHIFILGSCNVQSFMNF